MAKRIIFTILMVSLVVGGWITYQTLESSKRNADSGFRIPVDEMNQSVFLFLPPDAMDAYKSTGMLAIVLANKISSGVVFPPDYNIEILISDGGKWIPVLNNFDYSTIDHILPTKAEYASGLVVFVAPMLSENQKDLTIRIIVYGTIIETDTQVGAYLDVKSGSE